MDLAPLIEKKRERLAELEIAIGSDDLFADPAKAREVMRDNPDPQAYLAAVQAQVGQSREARADISVGGPTG
jgi:hypothetical protein